MRIRSPLWLMSASALVLGCSPCGPGGSAVPFKRGESAAGALPAAVDPGTGAAAVAQAGLAYPEQTAQIELDGQPLKAEQGAIRAALQTGTGRPALLVTQDAEGGLALARSDRSAGAWSLPVQVTPLPLDGPNAAPCVAKKVQLEALGSTYALIAVDVECPAAGTVGAPSPPNAVPAPAAVPAPPPAPEAPPVPGHDPPSPPAPSASAAQTRPERHLWIAALEPQVYVREHIAIDAAERSSAPPVQAALQSRDLDGDGREDLVLALEVLAGEQAPTRVEVKLFDRAGGLAAANDEPERTLLELADQAKSERKHKAQHAFELAQRALSVHAALCRQSGAARLRIDGRGLDCGASLGAGRAASVMTAVLAGQGKLVPALALYQTLEGNTYRLTDNDRERARVALHALVDDHTLAFHPGPQLDLASGPRARRAAIAFIDEGHLLLRGTTGRSYDLASSAVEPVGIAADTTILDPTGQYAISEVVRACNGYHLSVVRATQAVAGVVTGPSVSEPLLIAAEPPANARCPELSAEQRHDDGGFRVLEWTAQGVLVSRDQTLSLLALDVAATALEPARLLSATDAIPAVTRSAQLTPDGRYLARLTSLGIAIYDRSRDSTRLFAVPEGAGEVGDIALSPSGRTLALVRGRQVFIGQPREPSSAAATARPPTPAAAQNPSAPSNHVAPQ